MKNHKASFLSKFCVKFKYVRTFNKCKFHLLFFQVHIKDFLGFTSGKLWFEKQVFKIIFPTYILFWDAAAVMIKISEIYIVLFFSKIYQAFFYNFFWIYFTTMMCVKHKIEPIHSRDKHIITKKIFGMVIH